MVIWRNLPNLCGRKSCTGAFIFDSFKRYYPKIDPTFVDKSIDQDEVDLHSSLASEWWDPQVNLLHAFNEVRVPFIMNCLLNVGVVQTTCTKMNTMFEGLKVLDVGCGGGVLTEALGRLRCDVVGLDASAPMIEVAKKHATLDKVVEEHVRYENTELSCFSREHPEEFDVVVASEVIEHVSNKEYFLKLCAKCLKDDGSLIITTPNRTLFAKLLIIDLCEFLKIIPVGTHDYEKFITPRELTILLKDLNCVTSHIEGFVYKPFSKQFESTVRTLFMYGLHALKNTEKPSLDLFRQDNKPFVL